MPRKSEMDRNEYGLRATSFYLKCMFGGVLACGVTHASVVTLDVAKCRTQAHSRAGRWPNSLIPSIRKTYVEEGLVGLRRGWVPTFFGYGAQGLFKFGLNEFFQDVYANMFGREWIMENKGRKMVFQAAASGSAEIFADIALCPFEMTKVRMQVILPGQEGGVATRLLPALRDMARMRAETKFPFGSLLPLWGRQVPYTMIKFVGFYQTAEFVYRMIESQYGYKKSDLSSATQLAITFGCGYWAGIFCAIATQPMDNLVSMKGIAENKEKPWGVMAREMGTRNLFLKGLGTRIIMIGTLTGLQWWIYGTTKYVFNFGTQ